MNTDCKAYRNRGGIGSLTDLNHPDQIWEEVKVSDAPRMAVCPVCNQSFDLNEIETPNGTFTIGWIDHVCGARLYVDGSGKIETTWDMADPDACDREASK